MCCRWVAMGAAVASIVCTARESAGNAAAYFGTGGTLFPMQSDCVRMLEERIEFRELSATPN